MYNRKMTFTKYGISQNRYKELSGFCEQYPEWKDELRFNNPTPKSQQINGMPFPNTNSTSDETANLAIKRMEIQEKINMVESTAREASPEFWEYIIHSACYKKAFWYMRDIMGIPCSERTFFDIRRKFFAILNLKKK